MADPEIKDPNIMMASTNIKRLLAGDTPRLIDEWQMAFLICRGGWPCSPSWDWR